jgi:hypothetical protein
MDAIINNDTRLRSTPNKKNLFSCFPELLQQLLWAFRSRRQKRDRPERVVRDVKAECQVFYCHSNN